MLAAHLDATLPSHILTETQASRIVLHEPSSLTLQHPANPQSAKSALEEVVSEQARTIARLITLLEKAGVHEPIYLESANAGSATPLAAILTHDNSPEHPPADLPRCEAESTVPQRGIFSSSCLSEHLSSSYNESMTVRFSGNISAEKMTRVVDRLVERHDALRASFDETGQIMKVATVLKIATPVTDLSDIQPSIDDPDRQEQRLRKLIADEVAVPFTLPSGPLFRCQLVLLGHDRAVVIFTAHHVICDGWSLDVLIHDLCSFYSEEIAGAPVSLTRAKSYLDYVREVTERQRSAQFAQARSYWHEKFADGFPVLVLPTDHPRSARRDFKAGHVDHSVPAAILQELKAVAAKHRCGFFAVLLSLTAILLARVAKQRRFVIALPTAEQPVIGQPELVGQCVNLLPFAVDLREGEAVGAFFERVQGDLLAAQENAIFTMISLLEDLRPPQHASGNSPISAGLTSVKKFKPNELPQSGFTVDYDANPKRYESFELYLTAVENQEGMEIHCHYDADLFEDLTVREWLTTLDSVFHSCSTGPSQQVLNLAEFSPTDSSPAVESHHHRVSMQNETREFLANSPLPELGSQTQPPGSSTKPTMAEPELLRALLPLWQRALGIGKILPDDEFFALGGHSIAAAQLFALIQRELGYSAPLATLYDASTPRLLASALCRGRGRKADDWQSLVAINRHGDRPPLFLVHGAEGNVLLYRSLAGHLGADQPVYGLQSAGLDGNSAVDGRFEHVARCYVDEIRQVQPHGPYMIGGYCLGGTLALEMAQQLLELGETTNLLALIEDYNIRSIRWPLSMRHRLMNRFFLNPYFHLQNLFEADGRGRLDFFVQKLRVETWRADASARFRWSRLRDRFLRSGVPSLPHIRIAEIYEEALGQYEVRPYPGELTVFLPKRHLAGFDVSSGGWEEVAQGGVRIVSLSVSPHGSLVEPYVRQLADSLRECIDRAIENSASVSLEPELDLVGVGPN
jgi:hypothetical protein